MKRAPSRAWMDGFFELAAGLLRRFDLTDEDPRLVANCSNQQISYNINHARVLTAFGDWDLKQGAPGRQHVDFLLPEDVLSSMRRRPDVIRIGRPRRGHAWVRFQIASPPDIEDSILEPWYALVQQQLASRPSPRDKEHHKSIVYHAAQDLWLRRQLLDQVFGIES